MDVTRPYTIWHVSMVLGEGSGTIQGSLVSDEYCGLMKNSPHSPYVSPFSTHHRRWWIAWLFIMVLASIVLLKQFRTPRGRNGVLSDRHTLRHSKKVRNATARTYMPCGLYAGDIDETTDYKGQRNSFSTSSSCDIVFIFFEKNRFLVSPPSSRTETEFAFLARTTKTKLLQLNAALWTRFQTFSIL